MARKLKEKTLDWLIKNYMDFFIDFKMEEDNIRSHFEVWKIDHSGRVEDYLWYILNILLHENAVASATLKGFYERNNNIYSQMLWFRRKIEKKPANEIYELMIKSRANMQYESTNLYLTTKICSPSDCSLKDKLESLEVPLEVIIKEGVIPFSECDRANGCACIYLYNPTRDKNDRIIKK